MSDGKLYQHRALNDEGWPIPYARLRAYVHATTEPAIMFHAADLRSPTENPAGADAGGRFAVYLDPSKSYDLRVLSQDGDPVEPTITIMARGAGERVIERTIFEPAPMPEPAPDPAPSAPDRLAEALQSARDAREAIKAAAAKPKAPEPPASIANLFTGDRPFAAQALALHTLWKELGHHVQRGTASPEQLHKHERLSGEIEFISKHAFEALG